MYAKVSPHPLVARVKNEIHIPPKEALCQILVWLPLKSNHFEPGLHKEAEEIHSLLNDASSADNYGPNLPCNHSNFMPIRFYRSLWCHPVVKQDSHNATTGLSSVIVSRL